MSDAPEEPLPPLFLLAQQLRRLDKTDPEFAKRLAKDDRLVEKLVCRTDDVPTGLRKGEEQEKAWEPWKPISRPDVIKEASAAAKGSRFGLVCDAGVGKSFNMTWLFDKLSEPEHRPRIPFLLHLDTRDDLERVCDARSNPDLLLDRLRDLVWIAPGKHPRGLTPDRLRDALERKRTAGQIILLFDGLDHALAAGSFAETLNEILKSRQWENCPAWVAGRPYAFKDSWDTVFAPKAGRKQWQFFQVDRFGEAEIRKYILESNLEAKKRGEPDTGDWFGDIPQGARGLLRIPRMLKLIYDIVRAAVVGAPVGMPLKTIIENLRLNTPADVYFKAYFEPGKYGKPETQGLIAQGLKDKAAPIGLRGGRTPNGENFDDRIERTGVLLGAMAFQLHAANSAKDKPEPNTSGLPRKQLRTPVVASLKAAEQEDLAEYESDVELLKEMNTHHADFLLLAQHNEEGWRFPNRTVQAFFAAHWAVTHGTKNEIDHQNMKKWIIDSKGKGLEGFDEFWQFAAEMLAASDPETPVRKPRIPVACWYETFKSCYQTPAELTEPANWSAWKKSSGVKCPSKGAPHDWVQWHRRMIYHTFPAMESWCSDTVTNWQKSFRDLERSKKTSQRRIWKKITGGFQPIKEGYCYVGADPLEKPPNLGEETWVKAFDLHQFPVTNEMYELFDSEHKNNRWTEEPHPLAEKKKEGGDDLCPVVNVTWYDAWCFAAWCVVNGRRCRLPSAVEWEHALRAGTAFRFSFGDDEAKLTDYAWFDENSENMTHPVRGKKANKNELFDMEGNVWEWCEDWYNSGQMYRMLRGGSWDNDAGDCRAAYRGRDGPRYGFRSLGFRLCLPGPA